METSIYVDKNLFIKVFSIGLKFLQQSAFDNTIRMFDLTFTRSSFERFIHSASNKRWFWQTDITYYQELLFNEFCPILMPPSDYWNRLNKKHTYA